MTPTTAHRAKSFAAGQDMPALAAVVRAGKADAALGLAAIAGRFGDGDLAPRHQ
jgi:hypothetical protein